MRRLLTASVALLFLVILAGCSAPSEPAAPERETTEKTPPTVSAHVRVVDLDGVPLPGMLPIATRNANAFDAPLVQGPLTGKDGTSTVQLPAGETLYVRAWDPAKRIFATNYFSVAARDGGRTGEMTITMATGAMLEATLLSRTGEPAASTNVGLMMFHPAEGPWWPGEGDTDERGHVRFGIVPPGTYLLKLKAINCGMIELPSIELPPGGTVDLGVVTLQ